MATYRVRTIRGRKSPDDAMNVMPDGSYFAVTPDDPWYESSCRSEAFEATYPMPPMEPINERRLWHDAHNETLHTGRPPDWWLEHQGGAPPLPVRTPEEDDRRLRAMGAPPAPPPPETPPRQPLIQPQSPVTTPSPSPNTPTPKAEVVTPRGHRGIAVAIPMSRVIELARQGMGCRKIAATLEAEGVIGVSHMTISRKLRAESPR